LKTEIIDSLLTGIKATIRQRISEYANLR